ncbi:MAG: glycosyltransferase [Gammaproteobacteria bacterium]
MQRLLARFGHWSGRVMLGRPDESLALSYFLRVNNIGDRINPAIVGAMAGRPTLWAGDRIRPHLLAAGSLMAVSNAQSHIWGRGVMHPRIGVGSPRREHVRALRGKLSVTALRAAGIAVGDVPLGDPGFFISTVVPRPAPPGRRYSLGLIPHYVDWNHPYVCALRQHENVRVIDVTCPEADFISQVVSCNAIVSSALHGLVIAESYGIPNIWAALSDSVAGEGFKFHDWFSTTRSPQKTPVQARSPRDLIQAGKDAALHDMSISLADMAGALREIVDSGQICVARSRSRKAYNVCRASPLPVFVISFNRSDCLQQCINSYVNADRPVDIIIHDNGSDDEDTLDTLEEFDRAGVLVIRGRKIHNARELNSVDVTIQQFFESWSEPGRYAVSDCDIELPRGVPVLSIYDELLDRLPKIQCVGPMLKISLRTSSRR